MKGLVLSGGGARGSYQVGALQAVYEISHELNMPNPFKVFTGSSVGSINTSFLAAHAGNQKGAVRRLAQMWESLHCDDVFETRFQKVVKIAARFLFDLSSGGVVRAKHNSYLLDTAPLRQLITRVLRVQNIQDNIDRGMLHGVAMKALDYSTGMNTTFFQGHDSILPWMRSQRLAERTQLTVDHIMASSAIPVVFPPVKVGDSYYGDGSIRNYTPLSPAIKMGAEKLMVITAKRRNIATESRHMEEPSLARISSILLNSLLLDNIDLDVERLTRINSTIQYLEPDSKSSLKPVDVLLLQPTQDLSRVAMDYTHLMPRAIRFLVQGWGGRRDASDVISNILFEGAYIQRIIEMGYEDTIHRRQEIQAFLQD